MQALGGADAKALAGGQTLIPVLKLRLNRPAIVVDLAGLGLSGIKATDGTVTIGAATTHAAVAASREVQLAFPALACLAAGIGDTQVRNRGTLGGSLANNDPAADYPAAALATDATIRTNRRAIAAGDFFQGLFTTALEPDEIITRNCVPGAAESRLHQVPQPGLALCHGRRVRGQGRAGGAGGGDRRRAERRVPPHGVRAGAGACVGAGVRWTASARRRTTSTATSTAAPNTGLT